MNGNPKEIEMNKEYTFYMLKVRVGRAYVMPEKNWQLEVGSKKTDPNKIMKNGYHSIYLQDQPEAGNDAADPIEHKFVILDKSRVSLLYKV